MGPPTVGFNSYVDIATTMARPLSEGEKRKNSVSGRKETEREQDLSSDWMGDTFEENSSDPLKSEWEKRINEWQEEYPDRGPPVESCTSLKELKFGALFLQHPFSAMAVWNTMQTFYAFDRLVCCANESSVDKIAEWESMAPFEYLNANKVENRLRICLKELSRAIKEANRSKLLLKPTNDVRPGAVRLDDSGQNLSGFEEKKNRVKKETLLWQVDAIDTGIKQLEASQIELRRSLKENLGGIKLVDMMLERMGNAARWRFAMIDTYLKMDETYPYEKNIDHENENAGPQIDIDPDFIKESTLTRQKAFEPLSRSNSIDVIKHQLTFAWISTKQGNATLSAIVVLIILLLGLNQLERCLIAFPPF